MEDLRQDLRTECRGDGFKSEVKRQEPKSRAAGGRDTVSSPPVSRWATIRPNDSTISRLSPVGQTE